MIITTENRTENAAANLRAALASRDCPAAVFYRNELEDSLRIDEEAARVAIVWNGKTRAELVKLLARTHGLHHSDANALADAMIEAEAKRNTKETP